MSGLIAAARVTGTMLDLVSSIAYLAEQAQKIQAMTAQSSDGRLSFEQWNGLMDDDMAAALALARAIQARRKREAAARANADPNPPTYVPIAPPVMGPGSAGLGG